MQVVLMHLSVRLSLLRPLTMELCVNFLFIRSFLFLWFNIMISNFIWLFFSFRHFNCLSVLCLYVLFANVYDIDNRIIKKNLTKKPNKTHIKPICAQVRLWMTVREKKTHIRSYWDRDRKRVCAHATGLLNRSSSDLLHTYRLLSFRGRRVCMIL